MNPKEPNQIRQRLTGKWRFTEIYLNTRYDDEYTAAHASVGDNACGGLHAEDRACVGAGVGAGADICSSDNACRSTRVGAGVGAGADICCSDNARSGLHAYGGDNACRGSHAEDGACGSARGSECDRADAAAGMAGRARAKNANWELIDQSPNLPVWEFMPNGTLLEHHADKTIIAEYCYFDDSSELHTGKKTDNTGGSKGSGGSGDPENSGSSGGSGGCGDPESSGENFAEGVYIVEPCGYGSLWLYEAFASGRNHPEECLYAYKIKQLHP